MKFAHMADCHIGSWRDPKLTDASTKAFVKAIDMCIEKNVDFILISGDLFNTSLPPIDKLKIATKKLKELNEKNIPVYIIAGSHDFSTSGKTMLDVLEEAGLLTNVAKGDVVNDKLRLKFTVDKKTGAKITGLLGKKGSLEKSYYESLDKDYLEKETGYKIFMFHSMVDEFKQEGFESIVAHPLSLFPKGFDYYAGGHVHIVFDRVEKAYGRITYPGPLFPNNFAELEKLQKGGFYIIEDGKIEWLPVQIHNVFSIKINCDHKTPEQVKNEVEDKTKNQEFYNTIVTIRLTGTLESGKISDIDFNSIFRSLYDKSAYFVMRSTSLLETKEFQEIKIQASSVEEIESKIVKEHLGQRKISDNEEELTKELMKILSDEKQEGERVADFEKRLKENIQKIISLGE